MLVKIEIIMAQNSTRAVYMYLLVPTGVLLQLTLNFVSSIHVYTWTCIYLLNYWRVKSSGIRQSNICKSVFWREWVLLLDPFILANHRNADSVTLVAASSYFNLDGEDFSKRYWSIQILDALPIRVYPISINCIFEDTDRQWIHRDIICDSPCKNTSYWKKAFFGGFQVTLKPFWNPASEGKLETL